MLVKFEDEIGTVRYLNTSTIEMIEEVAAGYRVIYGSGMTVDVNRACAVKLGITSSGRKKHDKEETEV